MQVLRSIFLTVLCVAITFCSLPAFAGKKEVETLHGIFTEMLDLYASSVETEHSTLVREGDIIVEDSGSYYAVTLPHLKFKSPEGVTDIGMIAVNAVPEGDGKWKMTLALPTPIVAYDLEGRALITTDIGAQNFTGLWDENVKYFTASKALYRDIKVTHASKAIVINIPEISLAYQIAEGEKDRWSGPMNFTISGLNFTGQGGAVGKVGTITMKSSVTDYSFEEALAYQDKLTALNESYIQGEGSVSTGHVMGLYNLITDFIGNAWEGFDFDMIFEGVELHNPARGEEPPTDIGLTEGHLGFGMSGFRTGSVTVSYRMGYDGLKITPAPAGFDETTPDYLALDFSINKLPYKELVSLGKTSLENSVDAPAMAKIMGMQALMMVPQLLTEAQTDLTIRKADLGNDLYALNTTGKMVTDMVARMGMTGDARITLRGLDTLITKLNETATSPAITEVQKAKLQNLLQGLAIMQMAGQIEKNDKGEDIRVYNLEITKDGKAMLNGSDMSVFMGGTSPQ